MPHPEFPIKENKTVCRVCQHKLRIPVSMQFSLHAKGTELTKIQLYNRALCSPDCLFQAYDDLDNLTDMLYEKVYELQDELALETHIIIKPTPEI